VFHKEVLYGWYILVFLVAGLMLINPLSSPTGEAVYTETNAEKVWDFSNISEYDYNSSILLNSTIQLKPITNTNTTTIQEINESELLFATEYDTNNDEDDEEEDDDGDQEDNDEDEEDDKKAKGNDDKSKNVTLKLQSLEQGSVELKDKSVIEIKLNHQLQSNDQLSFYILGGTDNGNIYLCEKKEGCSIPVYGSLALPSDVSAAWYNLTISGMAESTDTFFINSPDKIEIDMIKGYKKSTRNETTTSLSYPSSASLQTVDLQPADWESWKTFSKVEQLNQQQVQYEYSTDSGSSWNLVPADGDFTSIIENKVRFKTTLFSNTFETPIVNLIKLTYNTIPVCAENWTAQYGTCLVNNSKSKSYLDANVCGTSSALPSDNGTYIACDYCALFNCSGSVIKESLAEVHGNKTIYVVDAVAEANTKLEMEAANSTNVEIIEYNHDIKNGTSSSTSLNRYISLESDDLVSSVTISLYYQDLELTNNNIDENTLTIQYYNETSQQWEVLSSTVNISENYVSTTMPHMSFYGLFGEQPNAPADSASTTSSGLTGRSGGGGGADTDTSPKTPTLAVSQTVLSTQSQNPPAYFSPPSSELSCDYVVEMILPDQLEMRQDELYQGEILNTGTCKIAELKLELSSELQPMVDLSVLDSLSLSPGNKTNFILIRKEASETDLFSATSHVISSFKADPIVSGYIILEGHDDQEKVFRKELPLKIIMKSNFQQKDLIITSLLTVTILLLIARSFLFPKEKKKKNQERTVHDFRKL